MKPKLVCIFAHPDDEAFGPAGTIATFAKTHDVFIICVTKGEAGKKLGKRNLAAIRVGELKRSAKILGVKEVFVLGFKDGMLSNSIYHHVFRQIRNIIRKIRPGTLLTFEPQGVSGHIDHIAVSMVTSYAFTKTSFAKKLLYYCHTREQVALIKKNIPDYFIYFPRGYKKQEIDKTVDVAPVWHQRIRAMLAHASQLHDIQLISQFLNKSDRKEYFLVLTK